MSKLVNTTLTTGHKTGFNGSVIEIQSSVNTIHINNNEHTGVIQEVLLEYYDTVAKVFKPAALWYNYRFESAANTVYNADNIYSTTCPTGDGCGNIITFTDATAFDAYVNTYPLYIRTPIFNNDIRIIFNNDPLADIGIIEDSGAVVQYNLYATQWINKNLFRVNVVVSGLEDVLGQLPCLYSTTENYSYTYDKLCRLEDSVPMLRELANNCELPKNFIDFILRQKALDLAIQLNEELFITEHWALFTTTTAASKTKKCNCHGR